jgi:hypothetical protein
MNLLIEVEISEAIAKLMKLHSECLAKYEGQKVTSQKCASYKKASETFISTKTSKYFRSLKLL